MDDGTRSYTETGLHPRDYKTPSPLCEEHPLKRERLELDTGVGRCKLLGSAISEVTGVESELSGDEVTTI